MHFGIYFDGFLCFLQTLSDILHVNSRIVPSLCFASALGRIHNRNERQHSLAENRPVQCLLCFQDIDNVMENKNCGSIMGRPLNSFDAVERTSNQRIFRHSSWYLLRTYANGYSARQDMQLTADAATCHKIWIQSYFYHR